MIKNNIFLEAKKPSCFYLTKNTRELNKILDIKSEDPDKTIFLDDNLRNLMVAKNTYGWKTVFISKDPINDIEMFDYFMKNDNIPNFSLRYKWIKKYVDLIVYNLDSFFEVYFSNI